MKNRFSIALVFVTCFGVVSVRADEAANQKERLQGVWILSKGETNGKALDEVLRKRGLGGLQIKFSDDLMIMTGFGAPDHTYRFALTPTDRPKTIRLVTVETQGKAPKGSVLIGIYKIQDEELKLCLPADSTVERPKKFEAPSGSRLSMLVLRRQTNDEKTHTKP